MAYQPKSAQALANASSSKELVFSSQIFQQGETWFRLLPLDPTYATMGCIFPTFSYLHNGASSKRRLISYATFQKDCVIQHFLRTALSTNDVGIRKIVTEFINENKFNALKPSTPEGGSNTELVVSMVGLVLGPKMDKTSPPEFFAPEEFQGNPNPFICSIKQKTVQDAILNIGSSTKALTFLKAKEGYALCVNRTGQGLTGTKYAMTFSDSPVPMDEEFFLPQSASNPRGYPNVVATILKQTQSPECVLDYLLHAFLGDAHEINKSLEAQEFDPLADEADDRIAEVIASINTNMFKIGPSMVNPGIQGGIGNRMSSKD